MEKARTGGGGASGGPGVQSRFFPHPSAHSDGPPRYV